MTLVVEDGSGVANANTYISVADVSAFFTARGFTEPTIGFSATIYQVMDALDGFIYSGTKSNVDNAKAFPRTNCYDQEGILYGSAVIPLALKQGAMWLVYYYSTGSDLGSVAAAVVKIDKADIVEQEFFEPATKGVITLQDLPNAYVALRHLIVSFSIQRVTSGRVERG
jgi:hypothetical protein